MNTPRKCRKKVPYRRSRNRESIARIHLRLTGAKVVFRPRLNSYPPPGDAPRSLEPNRLSGFYNDINIDVKTGVRQGDTILLKLFSATFQNVKRALEWDHMGVKFDGRQLHHLCFDGDIVFVTPNIAKPKRSLHRRQRAVHRLVEELSSGKVLNKYLIPIIHPYLGDTESKFSALSDECLRLLKYTMGIAPWLKYVSCLDLWLKRLDEPEGNHKAIIRAIVCIVDAFHYEVAGVDETTDGDEMDKRFVVRDKLVRDMLPKLTSSINGNSTALSVHRKARTATTKQYTRDDDIRRAPVALAIVKLLRKLPESISRQYLHGVILKLCFLMMSRSIDVRDTARKVVVQLHVMIYTVHTLIAAMQQFLKSGDLDACLDDVLDIIVQEQFGNVSEEKEVGEIKAEVIEAKKNRSPGTLLLLGRFVSSSAVVVLLKRFEFVGIVDSLTSSKMISRARNLLSMFANGLKDNEGFAPASQLIMIHQMLVANIEKVKMVSVSKPEIVEKVEKPKSCLLLPSVISHALRCLIGVLHLALPSIQSSLDVLSKRLFSLLSEYSILGNAANKESVLSINQLLCKSFTQLIAMSNTSFLTDEHIALLLSYAEIDIVDTNRQATAFALIKALVRRKIQHPQVLDVIKKLKEMSVTSSFPHIRTQCREVLLEFIGNHPSSDNPQKYIEWFIAQLGYEFEDGRLSAVEMLHSLFSRLQPVDSLESLMKCESSVAVRLSAACLIGQCLNNYERTFFTSERSMKLVQWCYWQLRDRILAEDIALQASKILMAISRHLNEEHFNMLVEKLANICRFEIVHQPNLSLKRTTCLKMAAALAVREEDSSKLVAIVQLFLPFLVHEMNSKSSQDKELHSISIEVGEVFKSKVGEQRYATMLAECQKAAVIKAVQRKRKLKELSVTNPEEAALLKRKKTAKKALLKRRKIDALKPYRVSNRRRVMQKQMEQSEN
ncbi:unnamed protein product [Angiostrongylus costaricensis]|uniref:40S ribosomal protein S6 n=1 Tax=Angiostrongylus costaricensis TaxID=334426 RepID=A0A158PL15_ANGCS|nr:unnamed protein product [Angiostrongylus costaricensis]